jgi:SAM-dependent methyltransferase
VELDAFRALRTTEGERVLAEVCARGVQENTLLATISALRADHPEALVSAAVTQARLRERGQPKFGPDAARMFFTPDGVEQATRTSVAEHRARRFAGAGRVLDLCCGIGGDLIALARDGLAVHGVDINPLTVEVARANAGALGLSGVSVERAEATAVSLAGWPAAFCDPSRRGGGRRVFNPRAYSPPFEFLATLAAAVPATGAKVAPGIPHELVPTGVEAEWVSDGGDVKEAALWFGPLCTTRRRATLLPSGATLTSIGAVPEIGPVGRWLHEPDGAVIRAGLVAEAATLVGGRLIDATIAYITADSLIHSAFSSAYEVTDSFGFSLKRLRSMLRARDIGSVTVKKRGSAIDPALLRRELRLSGSTHATIVLTRVAGAPTVLLCEPVPR